MEEKIGQFISSLQNHCDITELRVVRSTEGWTYHYSIDGYYRDNYFDLRLREKNLEEKFSIVDTTDRAEDLLEMFSDITDLKFEWFGYDKITKKERLLRLSGLMTILRDDLEEEGFTGLLKQRTNMWLVAANKSMEALVGSSIEEKERLREELINVVLHYDRLLRVDSERRETIVID